MSNTPRTSVSIPEPEYLELDEIRKKYAKPASFPGAISYLLKFHRDHNPAISEDGSLDKGE